MPSFAVEFLGCKVNQYEAQALRDGLLALGLVEAPSAEEADVFVVNTCSVTTHAGATSRNRIRRASRANPGVKILVTGCYAESDREKVRALPGVASVFGNAEKDRIVGWVGHEVLRRSDVPAAAPLRLKSLGAATRAFVKIEDGCDDACSFCVIPLLRGPAKSRPEEEIVAEVEGLCAAGHREIVVTGVHLGYFGAGEGPRGAALARLLRRLAETPGLARLKISSLEVHELTPDLIDVLAGLPVLAPHFHLPLQSGSDRILARMRRKSNARGFAARVRALRQRFEEPAISTDVIVGFPGETDEDFRSTVAFCREQGFMKIHVFPYSVRPGTEAAQLAEQIPAEVVESRKRALLAVDAELGAAYRARFIGRTVPVLVEGRDQDLSSVDDLSGLSDRYLRVDFPGSPRQIGEIVDVKIRGFGAGDAMAGELVLSGVASA